MCERQVNVNSTERVRMHRTGGCVGHSEKHQRGGHAEWRGSHTDGFPRRRAAVRANREAGGVIASFTHVISVVNMIFIKTPHDTVSKGHGRSGLVVE